jgi:hypothetical protein
MREKGVQKALGLTIFLCRLFITEWARVGGAVPIGLSLTARSARLPGRIKNRYSTTHTSSCITMLC